MGLSQPHFYQLVPFGRGGSQSAGPGSVGGPREAEAWARGPVTVAKTVSGLRVCTCTVSSGEFLDNLDQQDPGLPSPLI